MNTTEYPPALADLARTIRSLQDDRRFVICREELLTYIDRHKRRASAEPADDRYACTTWNGGAAASTRKAFKFLLRIFKVNHEGQFINFRKRPVDADGFVRIFREEIQTAAGLGSTAVGQALARLEALKIITRKYRYDDATGHRQAWFRLNPSAIYNSLNALMSFRLAREEFRAGRISVERTMKKTVDGPVDKTPKIEIAVAHFEHRAGIGESVSISQHVGVGTSTPARTDSTGGTT